MCALASLAHGARAGESGLLVPCAEQARRIVAHTARFGRGLADLVGRNCIHALDRGLPQAVIGGGVFDRQGLLAGGGALARRIRARRPVLDGIDILLGAPGSTDLERRKLFAPDERLSTSDLTTVLTAKTEGLGEGAGSAPYLSCLSDCVVVFRTTVEHGVAQRRLPVAKLRGSAHSNQVREPIVNSSGINLADVSTSGREVLMGTLRWQKKQPERRELAPRPALTVVGDLSDRAALGAMLGPRTGTRAS